MLKVEKEYIEEYGDIPKDDLGRFEYLLEKVNLKHVKESVFNKINYIKNIKWKKEKFIIYLLPKATPRPRLGSRGIFYVSGAKDNKTIFQKFILNQDIDIINTPTKFYCVSYLPIPKSMNPIEKICAELGLIYPVSKPDWDNLAKTYCDMIQGALLLDDSLIIEGTCVKRYSVKPRIEITIEYMEEFDSEFNRKKFQKKGGS